MGGACSCEERVAPVPDRIDMIQDVRTLANATDDSDSNTDTDDDGSQLGPQQQPPSPQTRHRQSVSAEAYGAYNKRPIFKPPVYPKTPEQEQRIRELIDSSFLFKGVSPSDKQVLVKAFQVQNLPAETKMIVEGDDGDCLYLLDSGSAKVTRKRPLPDDPSQTEQIELAIVREGDVTGELALLYSAPRAASVTALENLTTFVLDRASFNNIVFESVKKQRESHEAVLKSAPILAEMNDYELGKLADAVQERQFAKGEEIIRVDDDGDCMYILVDGQASAFMSGRCVNSYKPGDYFGELALLNNQPRAATVLADTDCKALAISRKEFKRLCGPVEKIMKRNVERYRQLLSEADRPVTQP